MARQSDRPVDRYERRELVLPRHELEPAFPRGRVVAGVVPDLVKDRALEEV